jgi:hypothetical protein
VATPDGKILGASHSTFEIKENNFLRSKNFELPSQMERNSIK